MDPTCPGSDTSNPTSLARFLGALKQWQITLLMSLTMTLQLILVLSGFFRKRASHPLLHSLIWLSFIGLDALSAYGIGLMLGGGCDHVFSLWAPILLFHLGASDSINAYSPSDNDLWRRHSFKMTLEIIGSAYILSRSSNCTQFLGAASLIFIVGSFKYLERVYALWCGSATQVVGSSRAVYRFMALDQAQGSGIDVDHPHRGLIVSGESSWYRKHKLRPNHYAEHLSLVTYEDVVQCRELRRAARYINDACLAFALFKIYRRRLTNLRIHHKDEDYEKVKRIFFPPDRAEPSPLRIIRVIDMELSFIFDGTFTKGAAMTGRWFQVVGIATRALSILLLFVCTMYLLGRDVGKISCEGGSNGSAASTKVQYPGAMTILLVVVSFGVECLQAYKMFRSNWTRVWLACSYITEQRRLSYGHDTGYLAAFHRFNVRVLIGAFRYVGDPSKNKCWQERIGQRSVVVDAMHALASPWSVNLMRRFDLSLVKRARRKRAEILHVVDVNVSDVHYRLFEKMAQRFARVSTENLATTRDSIARSVRFPFFGGSRRETRLGPEFSASSDSGLEEAVLSWHLATSVCEMELILSSRSAAGSSSSSSFDAEAVKMSIALSRYCLYLLVEATGLTPADPDLCKPLYEGLVRKLGSTLGPYPDTVEMTMVRDYDITSAAAAAAAGVGKEEEAVVSGILVSGIGLGRRILEQWLEPEGRWGLLMEVWVDIIVYIAISENAHPHAEQLGKGGELLSHLWVLLGHLGFGQKSWISKPH